jgi:hypothetical protein
MARVKSRSRGRVMFSARSNHVYHWPGVRAKGRARVRAKI